MKSKSKKLIKKVFGKENSRALRLYINRFKRVLLGTNDKVKTGNRPTKYHVPNTHTFFGYYDKTPFSKDNSRILANIVYCENRPPKPDDTMTLGYFDLDTKKFSEFGTTTTWCWQQGCRLQWYPGDENKLAIYNRIVNGNYGAVIQDVLTKEIVHEYETPFYDISPDGRLALTLNFSRLNRLRPGYGYAALPDMTEGIKSPDEDGLFIADLQSGNKKLLISLKQISEFESNDTMVDAEHYFNHLSFNKSGNRFLFFHFWNKDSIKYSRMITSDLNGSNLYVVTKNNASHYTWRNDENILCYSMGDSNRYNYYLYKDLSKEKLLVGESLFKADGHPTYSEDGKLLLTDTKPDCFGDQYLLVYDVINGKLTRLAKYFNNPMIYSKDLRCDLHPRWDRNNERICIDSAHEGKRALYVVTWRDSQ